MRSETNKTTGGICRIAQRWVQQCNFYFNDRSRGRVFVRLCPYLLSRHGSTSISITGWPINCGKKELNFQQCSNAFLNCKDPKRLQVLADSLTSRDLLTCAHKWLAAFTPFFTDQERRQAGCQHRLFFAQVDYCDNLIFHRRAALDQLGERLLDANRTIGQPHKITTIFGPKVTKQYRGKLQTVIEDIQLPNLSAQSASSSPPNPHNENKIPIITLITVEDKER